MRIGRKYLKKAARQQDLVERVLTQQRSEVGVVRDLSFKQFIQLAMPSFQFYEWNEILIGLLQEVADGKLRRLLVQVPPRHGKSELAKLFAAYYLLRYQQRFVGVSSYSAELAYTFSRASRAYYQSAGGRFNPAASAVGFWETEARGGCWSAGSGGSITGKGAHVIVVDDPVKGREEAESPAYVRKLHDWYKSVLRTRLNPEDGSIVLIQTRWSANDLIGLVMDLEAHAPAEYREGWHLVDYPALYQADWAQRPPVPDCITVEEDFRTEPGAALCPERYDETALGQIRASIGSREFGALYMQNPVDLDSAIFKPQWWQWRSHLDAKYTRKVLSVDCTFTATETSDFVSIACLGQREDGTFDVIDILNQRLDVVDTMKALLAWVHRYKPTAVLIERAANGEAVIQMLGKKVPNIIGIRADKSKIARASGAAPMIEAGSVWLPLPPPHWIDPMIDQFSQFPVGKHDDMVDAVTQGLNWMRDREPMRQITATWGRSDHQRQVLPPGKQPMIGTWGFVE